MTKEKSHLKKEKEDDSKDFYLNEDVKNYDYADYVSIASGPRGMLFSFAKSIKSENKFGIFKEILLPYDVAGSLSKIIKDQIEELVKTGKLKPVEEDDVK